MATPIGITLPNNAVILELSDSSPINISTAMGGGDVRQTGVSVMDWSVGDFVQYDNAFGVQFLQSGVTFLFIDQQYIYFKQDPLP